jgi:hypothetical protein
MATARFREYVKAGTVLRIVRLLNVTARLDQRIVTKLPLTERREGLITRRAHSAP